jgi:hypothetical protein
VINLEPPGAEGWRPRHDELRNVARAIEREHAMRTDAEIERLSEMPADSIATATTK